MALDDNDYALRGGEGFQLRSDFSELHMVCNTKKRFNL